MSSTRFLGGRFRGGSVLGGSVLGGSFWSATRLVAQREIHAHLRTKSFWITFAVFAAGLLAAAIVPSLLDGDSAPTVVATVGPDAARIAAAADLETRPVASVDEANALVRADEVSAAVLSDPASPTTVRVVALTDTPYKIIAALAETPPVDLLAPDAIDDQVVSLISFGFALVFFLFAMFGIGIAQSVVVEKQTRIVEILVSTVPVRALLAGKIAAHSLLVFAQVGVLAFMTPFALRAGDAGPLLGMVQPALGWFVPFFVLGFVLLASMWAVAGSLVSRMEDLGTSSTLVTLLIMVPYMGVTFLNENDRAMMIMSYVPVSAAVAMPVRLFAHDPYWWEPFASMAILAATVVVFVLVATRLYTGSVLQTGGRVRLRRAWSGATDVI
jgi:ABC-2 type transport system permease protein